VKSTLETVSFSAPLVLSVTRCATSERPCAATGPRLTQGGSAERRRWGACFIAQKGVARVPALPCHPAQTQRDKTEENVQVYGGAAH
jgi:hypothetical protein